MDPITTAAAIAAASSAATSGGNMAVQSAQNKKARAWSTKENEKAYQRQLEMWEKSNLYNSPAAQMERFKAAKLNPNLMYGQGSAGLSSSPTPNYNAPEGQFKLPEINDPVTPALSQWSNMTTQDVQRDNVRAQEQKTRIDSNIALITAMDKLAQFRAKSPYYPELAKYNKNQEYHKMNIAAMNYQLKANESTVSNYLMDHGKLEVSRKLMNNQLETKKQQLLNYSLDAAIMEQRKALGAWQVYWGNKTKGANTAFGTINPVSLIK